MHKNMSLFQKIVSAAVVLVALVMGGSVSYYFVYLLPKIEREKIAQQQLEKVAEKQRVEQIDDLEQQRKCREDGDKVYQMDLNKAGSHTIVSKPRYYFNKEIKKCLYAGGIHNFEDPTAITFDDFVKDVYTNEIIMTLKSNPSEEGDSMANQIFRKDECELLKLENDCGTY